MQFAVPQFTDVEDKLIGPLTLKQFLMMLATGGVLLFFWSLFGFGIIFFLFGLPFALLGIVVTFTKYNGRPFFSYLGPMLEFVSTPKVMIYRREGAPTVFARQAPEKIEDRSEQLGGAEESKESRLSKLAYLLDQKVHEEEEIIEKSK